MIRISKRDVGTCAIEDTEYFTTRLAKYCDLCQLHLFCSIIDLQFVGTKTYDTHHLMHDIYLALSGLKLNFVHNKRMVSLAPDTLYQRFIEFSPLLPSNVTSWYFSLVTLFYNALSVELQEAIRLDGYTLSNNLTIATLSSQTSTLQVLWEKAVVAHKLLCEEK